MATGTLFVFMHGLSLVKDWPDHLEVVLPEVPGHQTMAGSWLEETPIARKALLKLEGVPYRTVAFPPADGLLDLTAIARLTRRRRAATLILPKPDSIIGLLRVIDPKAVTRADTGAVLATNVATIQIYVYGFTDETQIALNGHYWEPHTLGGAISLHVISTQEGPVGAQHEQETEDVLRAVLAGYPGLTYVKLPPPVWAAAEVNLFGGKRTLSSQLPQSVVDTQTGALPCRVGADRISHRPDRPPGQNETGRTPRPGLMASSRPARGRRF